MSGVYEDIVEISSLLRASHHPLFITGASISADSGLPTYRGIGGLYQDKDTEEGIPIESALSGEMLRSNPAIAWKYLWQIGSACSQATFNRGHSILAEVERAIPDTWVLTQNIDGFHRQAGSRNLIEIHGCASSLYCMQCNAAYSAQDIIDNYSGLVELPPLCTRCSGVVRPDVVLFGEQLSHDAVFLLYDKALRKRDIVFTIGTTGVFPYIAEPVYRASQSGVPVIEINPESTGLSHLCTFALRMKAAEALERIWKERE